MGQLTYNVRRSPVAMEPRIHSARWRQLVKLDYFRAGYKPSNWIRKRDGVSPGQSAELPAIKCSLVEF
jgi:hypothetical protein